MSANNIQEKMAKFFVDREGEGIMEEIWELDFMEAGIMDSLDLVSLAVHIEREFGVKVDLTDSETLKAFRRFSSLLQLVGG
jgi:acyl carrier protein